MLPEVMSCKPLNNDRGGRRKGALLVLLVLLPLGGCEHTAAPAAPADGSPARQSPSTAPDAQSVEAEPSPGTVDTASQRGVPAGGRIRECTFDDIKFEMEKTDPFRREMLTPEIEGLVGKRIRIRGYILPSFQQNGLTQFVLVRDNLECCFGPGAALYDCILVEMKPGKSTDFSVRPVAVDGTFSIRELRGPDRKHLAIYHLEGEAAE